jgi:ATP-binding cassette subfamily F protein 3
LCLRVLQVESRHYVLVGRNGTGKSTLLKAIGDGLIPGIPWSTRILLLGQTRDPELDEQVSQMQLMEETVVQHVLKSDQLRERYTKEAKILSEAIEQSSDPMAPIKALRKVTHDRLALQLKEANRIAERRSGARGKLARKELIKVMLSCVRCSPTWTNISYSSKNDSQSPRSDSRTARATSMLRI